MNDTHTITRIMDRLRAQYANRALLPRADGVHVFPCEELVTGFCVCTHPDRYTMSLNMLQRLFRCVLSEHQE